MKKNNQPDFSSLFNTLSKTGNSSPQEQAKSLLNELDEKQSRQLSEILQDKSKIDELLKSQAAQKIINMMKNGSNGQH